MQSNRPDHPWLSLSNKEMLKIAGFFKKDYETGKQGYTLAAALLFGKDEVIQQILPFYKTDALLRREDLVHYDDRREIRTNLIDAYDELILFIRTHLPDKFYMEGDIRVDLREKIFREVIANILIHREFTNAAPARLIIYRNKLVTENANNPVGAGPIDPDNFAPHPKNPAIVKFFQQLGRAEELGSGIRNIKQYLPLYSINSKFELIEGDTFRTIITYEEPDAAPQATTEVTAEVTTEATAEVKELISICKAAMSVNELLDALKLKNKDHFRKAYLKPALKVGFIEMTIPEYPNNSGQKYKLTYKAAKIFKSDQFDFQTNTTEVTTEVKRLISICKAAMSVNELLDAIKLKNKEHFRKAYLKPGLKSGYIEMTIPEHPKSPNQKYQLAEKGKKLKKYREGKMKPKY